MKYHIGQTVNGKITGIQPYGAFVSLADGTNGLIHISEISDDFVKDVNYFVRIGEVIQLKIIDIDENSGQLRLSLKALHPYNARKNRNFQVKSKLPTMRIGFRSLELHLDEWIATKQKEIEND